jgi:voltage-gated potassium channel
MKPSKLISWKAKLHEVIFEADTRAGKLFDIVLLILILGSVAAVMLESVNSIRIEHGHILNIIEWGLTILFSIEYITRIISIKKPLKYIFSFYGLIDLLSILPTYLGLFITGASSMAAIRSIRLLRVFRILKLARYLKEAAAFKSILIAMRPKIIVFLVAIFSIVTIMGTVMYIIEDYDDTKFTSIPRSIYWAVVTLTTVGYGDISPQTVLGQVFASLIMVMGYSIIVIPTVFVVTSSMLSSRETMLNTQSCPSCSKEGHDNNAEFCKYCGDSLGNS